MINPYKLKVWWYAACLISLNEYLSAFLGAKVSGRIGDMERNEIILNSIPNWWIKQDYVQGFDFKNIT